jgi:hypothetical protein
MQRRHVEPICMGNMARYGEYSGASESNAPFGQVSDGGYRLR